MKFVNRRQELTALQEKWNAHTSQLLVIYGKRRVGKTELIRQFGKQKPCLYFLADKRSQSEQLKELGRLVGEFFEDAILARHGFADWLEVFVYLSKAPQPFIFAIDEYPYLVESDPAVSSVFQKGWDLYLKDSKIVLILSGSSIAMMESETLIQKSPLFGRRTGQILVEPLGFAAARAFFPKTSFNDFMSIYTVTGGMPAYVLQLDPQKSLAENIRTRVFNPTEFLFNEVEFTLKEELREPKNYLAILRAIAFGKRKFGEIANDTGLSKNVLTKYLTTLEHLRLLEKEVPVTEFNKDKSRKGLYQITDNFFRFWFQFVYPYKSELNIGRDGDIIQLYIERASQCEALVYEDVCRQLIIKFESRLFHLEHVGRWWDKNEEIDVVGLNTRTKQIVFGECKWSIHPVGTDIYLALKAKAKLVLWERDNRQEYFLLFSKSGFTADMKKLAKKEKVLLVHGDKMID